MKIVFLLAVAVMMLGCATASQTYLPTGESGYSINCSGGALTWANCFSKAGELCGNRGYRIIDRNGEQFSAIGGGVNGFFGGSTLYRTMLIRCN